MTASDPHPREWFDDEGGLRFACTQCGNCCSGPPGYVLFTDEEAARLAARLDLSVPEFLRRYAHDTARGRSLRETRGPAGLDCVFLDRASVPGRAICAVYEDRPAQCRAWPFWPIVVRSREDWGAAGRVCPGIGRGQLVPPERVRIIRSGARAAGDPARSGAAARPEV